MKYFVSSQTTLSRKHFLAIFEIAFISSIQMNAIFMSYEVLQMDSCSQMTTHRCTLDRKVCLLILKGFAQRICIIEGPVTYDKGRSVGRLASSTCTQQVWLKANSTVTCSELELRSVLIL